MSTSKITISAEKLKILNRYRQELLVKYIREDRRIKNIRRSYSSIIATLIVAIIAVVAVLPSANASNLASKIFELIIDILVFFPGAYYLVSIPFRIWGWMRMNTIFSKYLPDEEI